jgi:hypothetical protein
MKEIEKQRKNEIERNREMMKQRKDKRENETKRERERHDERRRKRVRKDVSNEVKFTKPFFPNKKIEINKQMLILNANTRKDYSTPWQVKLLVSYP